MVAKDELDELLDGLNTLDVRSLLRANPIAARSLFVQGAVIVHARLCSPGSNAREKEAQLGNWANFLEFVDGKCMGKINITIHDAGLAPLVRPVRPCPWPYQFSFESEFFF